MKRLYDRRLLPAPAFELLQPRRLRRRGIHVVAYRKNHGWTVTLRCWENILEIVERETGIEPATTGLGSRCSTIELLPLCWQSISQSPPAPPQSVPTRVRGCRTGIVDPESFTDSELDFPAYQKMAHARELPPGRKRPRCKAQTRVNCLLRERLSRELLLSFR
jgi:hypothetical protein